MAPSTSSAYNGYCAKCRQKHDFDGEVHEVEGRRMAKGGCPACGTRVNRMLGRQATAE